jgi:hypothetical protein
MDPSIAFQRLETRIGSLETSLRRTRILAVALALSFVFAGLTAFAPQSQEEVSTQRLVLTDSAGLAAIALVAGPQSSLIIQSPVGDEVMRIGGSPARRIGH